MPSDFERLTAYRLAVELSDPIYRAVVRWPSFDRWSTGIQLMRAIDSVGANIAEAAGRHHISERRQFLRVARGSLYETEHWLGRARSRGLLDGWHETDQLARALNGLIKRPGPS
ncbi:MAG: hypothetical protein QOJ07_2320 [Thermoleophilaceae bacterium]|nr:hypothetical protein [Thermoleophilaceae bacterium]